MPSNKDITVDDTADTSDEVKGPDPTVWGDDADRPSATPVIDEEPLDDDGNPMEVKGPDPDVWGDS